MSADSNSFGSSVNENQKDNLSSRLDFSESFKTAPNSTPPFSDSAGFKTAFGFDSPLPRKMSDDTFQMDHDISTNSFEPERFFKELQATQSCKPRNSSTPIDPSKCQRFSSRIFKDISPVAIDDEKKKTNQDTLKEDHFTDACSLKFEDSASNTTVPQFNFENHVPEYRNLPASTVETSFDFTRFGSEHGAEMDASYFDYVTAKDSKITLTDNRGSYIKELSTIEPDKCKSPQSQTGVKNQVQFEWIQHNSQDFLTPHKPRTNITSNLNWSFSSTFGSKLANCDDFDDELDSLKKEFDLESISDEDFDSDNIYEEITNLLRDDFLSNKNACISAQNTDDKLKNSSASKFQLNAYTGYDNEGEKSFSTTYDSSDGLLQSTCSGKGDLAPIVISNIGSADFSEDTSYKEASKRLSTSSITTKEHVDHSASVGGHSSLVGDHSTSVGDHIVCDAAHTKFDIAQDGARIAASEVYISSDETDAATCGKYRKVNISNDIIGREKTSNCFETFKTIEDSLLSLDSSLEKHANMEKIRSECIYNVGEEIQNKFWGLCGVNLYEIIPPSPKNLNKSKPLKIHIDSNMRCKEIFNIPEANCKISESECGEPNDPTPYIRETGDSQNNSEIPQSSASSVPEKNPLVVNYVRVNIEPLSDSYEMNNKYLSTIQANTSLDSTLKIQNDAPTKKYVTRKSSRIKQEYLSGVKKFLNTENAIKIDKLDDLSPTQMIQLTETDSYSLITKLEDSISDKMDTQDPLLIKVNEETSGDCLNTNANTSTNKSASISTNPSQLKQLCDSDKNFAKAVIKAITDLDRKTGVKQSQILKYIKQHNSVRLHPKLNHDITRFLESACKVRIIKKSSRYKYMLSDPVKTIAARHEKEKKEAKPDPQIKGPSFIVKPLSARRMETNQKNVSMPVRTPTVLRRNRAQLKAGTPIRESKVFKALRSRVVFKNK